MLLPKPMKVRDPKYRRWIAGQDCLIRTPVCRQYQIHAAHVTSGGLATKGDDDKMVPLCYFHHIVEQHGQGIARFQERYQVDLLKEAARYRAAYEETQRPN